MRGQKMFNPLVVFPKGKHWKGSITVSIREALKVSLNDGEVPLDNDATERALRSSCLHKHTWKLIDSIRYLAYVLTVSKDHQDDTDYSFIEKRLPGSDQIPEICRSKSKTTNV